MNITDEPDVTDGPTTFASDNGSLALLQAVLAAVGLILAAITIVGAIFFVVPTLTGSAKIWQDGVVSGLPVGGGLPTDLPTVAATAEGVTERLDFPGTDRSGRLVVEGTQANVEVNGVWLDARLVYNDPSIALRLVVVTRAVLGVALAWAVLIAFYGIVRSSRNGDPFSSGNIKRLRLIATAAIMVRVGDFILGMLRGVFSPDVTDLEGVTFRSVHTTSFVWFAAAAAIFALAEIFAHGRQLHLAEEEVV